MAVDYEQYRSSSATEQQRIVNEAQGRLDTHLQLGPKLVDTNRFFSDVYLLKQTGFFILEPELEIKTQRMAADPKIRGEYVNRLKNQDTVSNSKEVLATLETGRTFGYHQEGPFKVVFDKLETKHAQLIAEEEERQRAEEARKAEEARRKEEAAAKRKAKSTWPPESNTGKSSEWVQAQEKIARLWEEKNRHLPQGLNRETEAADIAYFEAGFNLLKNEILTSAPMAMELRAMLEYLIPRMWRQPVILERFIKKMTPRKPTKPANLAGLDTLSKAFYIPAPLQGLTQHPNKEQSKQINTVFRSFTKSMHPDVAVWPDTSENLKEYVDTIYKSFTSCWSPVLEMVNNSK